MCATVAELTNDGKSSTTSATVAEQTNDVVVSSTEDVRFFFYI